VTVAGDHPGVSEHKRQVSTRQSRAGDRQALFDRIRALYDADVTIRNIARELGLGLRRVQRWVRLIELPARNVMAPKTCTPAYHGGFLARRWADGVTEAKALLAKINQRGYTGSQSHLARFLAPWRTAISAIATVPATPFPRARLRPRYRRGWQPLTRDRSADFVAHCGGALR
jgi:hypothetical protein